MKKAALHNLGCKVNSYETEAMQQLLEQAGYEIVPFSEKADVYVINTCSVTNMADRKSRQMLHRARKQNPDAVVVAAGCYVQTKKDEVLQDMAVDLIIGNNRKNDLVALLDDYFQKKDCLGVIDINACQQEYEEMSLSDTAEHTRAFIKVQDGCNQFCSYCIIPYARGRVRSRRLDNVLAEISRLADKGFQEVVLTGIHLSSYGVDTGDSLIHLIEEVHKIEGIKRIRLGSLEPKIVTEDFAGRLSRLDKICPHFHLSLQSGCDDTLKRMNRKYSCAEYEAGCSLLRRFFDRPAITTDVIVGFPGETTEEFEQTKAFLERIHFYEMHIFKYSKRQGTQAAKMEHQILEEIKTQRSAKLLELAERMSEEYRRSMIGQTKEVLFEEIERIQGEDFYTGYTKEYIRVATKSTENLVNQTRRAMLVKKLSEGVYEAEVQS